MNVEQLPSRLLEHAVSELAKLPGIGQKTALRLALHLLKQEETSVSIFANSILEMRRNIKQCRTCYNLSDSDVCSICSNASRNRSLVCVVETIKDVMAVENTHQYNGLYHVLGGRISPIDGIGPNQLTVMQLEQRVTQQNITEVIFALSSTMEGDTTNYFIYKKLQPYHVRFTTLSRGVAFGDELEYADEVTLGRSIVNRIEFKVS